jgi:prepilin-type N-terminal cleavage/methylation domain-containing protein
MGLGRRRSVRGRGFTLVETMVVLMIGIVVTLSLWPLALDLLRRQQRLTARALTVRTFALLDERLESDFDAAASFVVVPPWPSLAFRLRLLPREAGAPEVVWDVAFRTARRTERPTGSGDKARETARSWALDGTFMIRRDELLLGRCVLVWEPDGGPAELLAFVPEPTIREER